MSFRFSAADLDFLAAGEDDLAALAPSLTLRPDSTLRDLDVARRRVGDHAAAAVETLTLRRRAVPKLGGRAAGWWLTDEALQQATPWPVAVHRAGRLAGVAVHDVTCSIGADLAALVDAGSRVLGSDLDPVRVRMARHNVGPVVVRADALQPISSGMQPYADPARRDGSGRRILSAATVPSLDALDRAWPGRPPVLRVPPGVDYDALARPGEVEIVSLDGSAREAVLWPPALARVGRRATVLSSTGPAVQLTDLDPDEIPVGPVGRWLVDPDPAVVRSHLVRQYGFRHGLGQLDPHLAYLTGDVPPPVGRAFRVLESAPFKERTVADWLRAAGAGTVEIKVRGLPVIPDELRLRLRKALTGPRNVERTLVLARVGRHAMAYLTQAVVVG
ncbi:THUMP-like domain-containing protein [Nakamurella deserti]|uniref:THUMP-like domain-containing protein n=1 Tax=Nakamurella deserti TaxID=2164074 RepID=UPI000DBE8856|nr:class I SAM-dependent methyltransferase [Nakamurella deserti]